MKKTSTQPLSVTPKPDSSSYSFYGRPEPSANPWNYPLTNPIARYRADPEYIASLNDSNNPAYSPQPRRYSSIRNDREVVAPLNAPYPMASSGIGTQDLVNPLIQDLRLPRHSNTNTVWGRISDRIDQLHSDEFVQALADSAEELARPVPEHMLDSGPIVFDYGTSYGSAHHELTAIPEDFRMEMDNEQKLARIDSLRPVSLPLVKTLAEVSGGQFGQSLDSPELEARNPARAFDLPPLTFPPCPECGHKIPSNVTSTWSTPTWANMDGFITREEAQQLTRLLDGPLKTARVGGMYEDPQGRDDAEFRRSDIAWINNQPEANWLFDRVWEAISQCNDLFFKYDLQWIEPLQYTVYHAEKTGFYGPHYDWGNSGQGMRKLSFTVQLSDETEYTGGELLLHAGKSEPIMAPKGFGTVTVFPSWMYHEVLPVTQGVRKSLVGWLSGPFYI